MAADINNVFLQQNTQRLLVSPNGALTYFFFQVPQQPHQRQRPSWRFNSPAQACKIYFYTSFHHQKLRKFGLTRPMNGSCLLRLWHQMSLLIVMA